MSKGERRYALRGVVRGQPDLVTLPFVAFGDDDAWEQADAVEVPPGFLTAQMIEVTGEGERNVPVPMSSLAAAVAALSQPNTED